jgi:hypothetical protein
VLPDRSSECVGGKRDLLQIQFEGGELESVLGLSFEPVNDGGLRLNLAAPKMELTELS